MWLCVVLVAQRFEGVRETFFPPISTFPKFFFYFLCIYFEPIWFRMEVACFLLHEAEIGMHLGKNTVLLEPSNNLTTFFSVLHTISPHKTQVVFGGFLLSTITSVF